MLVHYNQIFYSILLTGEPSNILLTGEFFLQENWKMTAENVPLTLYNTKGLVCFKKESLRQTDGQKAHEEILHITD